MTEPSTSTQVPSAGTGHADDGVQRAPDGRPYAIQPGDRVASSGDPPGGADWRASEMALGCWFAVGFFPFIWGLFAVVELVTEGTVSLGLGWTLLSAVGLTMAARTAIRARRRFGRPTSSALERSMLGVFRKRW